MFYSVTGKHKTVKVLIRMTLNQMSTCVILHACQDLNMVLISEVE